MNYQNKTTLDLDFRLNHELSNNDNYYQFSAIITSENIQNLIEVLKTKNIQPTLVNVTSIALRRYFENYRKKNKHFPKHCLIAQCHLTHSNEIYINGVIQSNNPMETSKHWRYGQISIQVIKNIKSYINTIVSLYKKTNVIETSVYISKNFGTEVYNTIPKTRIKKATSQEIDFLPGEYFKPIPYYLGYFISNEARVMSNKRNKKTILTQRVNGNGTLYVTLYNEHKQNNVPIITLMAKTFFEIDNLTKYQRPNFVETKDGNKQTLKLKNLVLIRKQAS